jgi:hypothetical protein
MALPRRQFLRLAEVLLLSRPYRMAPERNPIRRATNNYRRRLRGGRAVMFATRHSTEGPVRVIDRRRARGRWRQVLFRNRPPGWGTMASALGQKRPPRFVTSRDNCSPGTDRRCG